MKFLIKIILLAFVFSSIAISGIVDKNEPQKEEVKAKKKKKKRGKAFFFAVYCIACYAICPSMLDSFFKNEIEAQTFYIKEGLSEFDRQFDKAVQDEINRRKQDSYISCVLYERLEDQLKEEIESEKRWRRELFEEQLIKLFDVIKVDFPKLLRPCLVLSPLLLPALIFIHIQSKLEGRI